MRKCSGQLGLAGRDNLATRFIDERRNQFPPEQVRLVVEQTTTLGGNHRPLAFAQPRRRVQRLAEEDGVSYCSGPNAAM